MNVENRSTDVSEEDALESLDSLVSVNYESALVSVTSTGPVLPRRAAAGARAGRRLAMRLGYKVIFDISQARVSLSMADAYFLARDPKVRRRGFESVAIVSPKLEGADWARFMELTAANTGILLRVFSDREAAVSALGGLEAMNPDPGTDKVILVVDDDPDVLTLTSRVIRNAGYRVHQAAGGEEALRMDSELRTDLDDQSCDI